MNVVFVTGNPEKATNFAKQMGKAIAHQAAELDEIQTLDATELVTHKVKQAYGQIGKPVLVEDVSFVYEAWGKLPGPFVKYFVQNGEDYGEKMCRMLDGFASRRAEARCTFGYYDGTELRLFDGLLGGVIADHPRGTNGYGFDRVFEPDGFGGKTAGELTGADYDKYYASIKPFDVMQTFLHSLDK